MSDENEEAEEVALPSARDEMVKGLEDLADLLDVFVVSETSVVMDITGAEHKFAPVISARRALRATQMMYRMMAGSEDSEVSKIAQYEGNAAAIRYALLSAATDGDSEAEKMLQSLFETVQPGVLKSARKSAAKAGLLDMDGEPATEALDMFETDQVVNALLPFSSRIASKLGHLLRVSVHRQESRKHSQRSRS